MGKSNGLVAANVFLGCGLIGALAHGPAASAQVEPRAVLEEIIVIAQKRSQALADIPVSIYVLSGDLLGRQQSDNFQKLEKSDG